MARTCQPTYKIYTDYEVLVTMVLLAKSEQIKSLRRLRKRVDRALPSMPPTQFRRCLDQLVRRTSKVA